MGHLKWYARDPRAAIIGMMVLTLEERGAYNTILDLIYLHDGALEDDEESILTWLRTKRSTWRRIRARLLSLGKLYIQDGCLRSERADSVVVDSQLRWLKSVKMNDKRWGALREIKDLQGRRGVLTTTTLKKVSAKVVPISKRTSEESGEK